MKKEKVTTKSRLKKVILDQSGQSMIEYAVIIGIVIVIAVALVLTFGEQITALFELVTDSISSI